MCVNVCVCVCVCVCVYVYNTNLPDVSWCDGSSDQSFMMNPLNYFSFQPVLHDWYNKGRGMCYPV